MEDRSSFVTSEDLAALTAEIDVMAEDLKTMAERQLAQSLPQAVLSMIKLSQNAQSENVRLNASKYIVERNLGMLKDMNAISSSDPLVRLYDDLREDNEPQHIKDARG